MIEKYVMALIYELPHNVRTDKLGPANDQNTHKNQA
jgi:hypothetical protein